MSTEYKTTEQVPNNVLSERLIHLAKAVVAGMCHDESRFLNEFTCRIPAECDRDADLVLSEAAKRVMALDAAQVRIAELEKRG